MTIEEAFNKHLPPTVADAAILNSSMATLTDQCEGIKDALSGAFKWHETPQGFQFWAEIQETAE